MTHIDPPPEDRDPEQSNTVPIVVAILCMLLLFASCSSEARVTLVFSPGWVLLINPPAPTECGKLGFKVVGPDGEHFNAAVGVGVLNVLGADITPLTTATAERLFCDGFE